MKYEKYERANVISADEDIQFMLGENEQILWQGKPNKRAYITNKILAMLPIALIWLAIDLAFVIVTFKFDMPTPAKIGVCVFVCFHLIPFWMWLSNALTASRRHKNTHYALTTHRILIRTGLIGVDVQSVSYKDVQSVNLKIGVIDKMLKVGDLYFYQGGRRAQTVFFDIPTPYEVYKMAQKIVADIQTDIEFPNAYRPLGNPGYKTKPE